MFDGDTNFTTNNKVLLEAFKEKLTTLCSQMKPKKVEITDVNLAESNKKGFNNNVGSITNTATSMYDVLALFEKDSMEYKELSKRILCTQLYQQNILDSAKGCPVTYMSKEWTDFKTVNIKTDKNGNVLDSDEEVDRKLFYQKLITDKKPYFMKYIYPKLGTEYNKHTKKFNEFCMWKNTIRANTINDLLKLENKTEEELVLCEAYLKNFNLTDNKSTMNIICHKVEDKFRVLKSDLLKNKKDFNYNILKCHVKYTQEQFNNVYEIYSDYCKASYNRMKMESYERGEKDDSLTYRQVFLKIYKDKLDCLQLTEEELCDIIVDITYTKGNSSQFMWDICGKKIIENLWKIRSEQLEKLKERSVNDETIINE